MFIFTCVKTKKSKQSRSYQRLNVAAALYARNNLRDVFIRQRIKNVLAVPDGFQYAFVAHIRQVMRKQSLLNVEFSLYIADTHLLALVEQINDAEPDGVCNRLDDIGYALEPFDVYSQFCCHFFLRFEVTNINIFLYVKVSAKK
jgi:hypothetical protein